MTNFVPFGNIWSCLISQWINFQRNDIRHKKLFYKKYCDSKIIISQSRTSFYRRRATSFIGDVLQFGSFEHRLDDGSILHSKPATRESENNKKLKILHFTQINIYYFNLYSINSIKSMHRSPVEFNVVNVIGQIFYLVTSMINKYHRRKCLKFYYLFWNEWKAAGFIYGFVDESISCTDGEIIIIRYCL